MFRKVFCVTATIVAGAVLTACSASPGTRIDSSNTAAIGAAVSSTIDWQPQGNKSEDAAVEDAAFRLWNSSRSANGPLTDERVLYAGDTGMVGVSDGACGVVVLGGRGPDGGDVVGWFASTGALAPTDLAFLGEEPFVATQQEQSIATEGACLGTGASTALALAAPGMRIAPPTPMDLAFGEYGPQAPLAVWAYKPPETPDAVLTLDGKLVSIFHVSPATNQP